MRFLIVGLGSIGHRHLVNLRQIEPTASITVWHQHSRRQDRSLTAPLADNVVYELGDALDTDPDVALITCPAPLHVETGLALARQSVHLFIEKPLSDKPDGVDDLLSLCHERSLTLMVGYNFRFYPPLEVMRQALLEGRVGRAISFRAEAGQYLPDWRPESDYRLGVTARRDLGGGAVLELSHELDYARWLLGEVSAVSARIGRLGDLDIDVEDTAEITLQFANGTIGSVHLDLVQRMPTRYCRIIGTEGTLVWNWDSHSVRLFSAATKTWLDLYPPATYDRNEMYIAELRHFLECVKGNQAPIVSGADGRRALEIALAAKRSSQEERVIQL